MRWVLVWAFALACFASAAAAEKIELANGDVVDVTIVEQTEESLVVEHPQLGRMTVPRSALKPPPPPIPGLFGTKFMEGWTKRIGAGFSGSSGNSNDASFNGALGFDHETKGYRSVFDSAYFYSSQQSVRNKNEFYANYKHDFLLGESGFYLFGQGRYQYDQFQPWLHRFSGNTGAGYDFWRTKSFDLSGELGLGVARTEGTENEWKPEGVAGIKGAWRPFEGHEFRFDVTYFPNLENLPEFRLLSNAAYQIAISPIDGLSLLFGLKDEYDDAIDTTLINPITGLPNEKNNLKYFGQLVYDF
ncbi:MAG TPA: DUF481 domain-containing protein [Planctomycetota bacterium]|nr:DUF481 domain-containing protein [Planctomycetota bacterium]